ncbi:MAG: isoprenylcysteine carboxylmethyltransferase family protein [Prolixibacteraceae bacterium]|nr:isoprenylcysteine carboxylmethyltransferase family protein [Prolixibacteraceae bacterium]
MWLNKYSAVMKYLLVKLISLTILLVSSGYFLWAGAWTVFGFDVLYLVLLLTVGLKYFPETVLARKQTKFVHKWDKTAILIYSVSFYSQYLLAGLTFRFSLTSFNTTSYILGTVLYAFALGITFWVLATNPFATGSARIQEDRNQKIISSGPYKYLRHPMYFSTIIFSLSTPLILCSLWAYIPFPLVLGSFLFRCYKEDKMLQEGLEGYREYTQKVRYRMVPFIW